MSLTDEIPSLISGEVATDEADLKIASRDASIFSVTPKAVTYPRDAEDIKSLVRYATAHADEKVSLTARSGGTDMSGGPLNESIIVDVSRHLNQVISINSHRATVQPGTFYRDFAKAILTKNLLLPSYPASREIATVGGMVSNNSGGEKSLAFGKTEKFVEELKVVLSDGNEYTFGKLSLKELQAKMAQPDFEGDIYRQIVDLIDANEELITAAKPKVSKNSAGYNLWNVYSDHAQQFNLAQLFVGAQGTLGIITEITFRLITPAPHTQMLVIFLPTTDELGKIVNTVLRYHPESFESYDDHTVKLALKFFPQMVKQMGTNLISLAFQFLPEIKMLITGGAPHLVLLAEFTGNDKEEIHRRTRACQAALQQFHLQTHLVKNTAEANKYWTIRRESFNLLRKKVKHKHTAPFIDDVVVRPDQLPQFLPRLNEIMSQYNLIYTVAGHAGDANFHIIPLMDFTDPEQRAIIPELSQKVYKLVFEFHGSISGEHNDGLIRSHFLPEMYGEQMYSLFKQVKNILDPKNIFNPGKKIDSDWAYAEKHIIQE
ncbi:MAG: FAD-binding oxidoreductase [Candidatus Andersenbacteria bacterium]|nr:FAD-binding oxidoreductase [Candidatus Andersenbacteria bacterium]